MFPILWLSVSSGVWMGNGEIAKVISFFHFSHAFLISADARRPARFDVRSALNWGCYTITAKRDFAHHCLADSNQWNIQDFCRHKKSTCPYASVHTRQIPQPTLGVKQTRSYLGAQRWCMCRIAINMTLRLRKKLWCWEDRGRKHAALTAVAHRIPPGISHSVTVVFLPDSHME